MHPMRLHYLGLPDSASVVLSLLPIFLTMFLAPFPADVAQYTQCSSIGQSGGATHCVLSSCRILGNSESLFSV